MERQPSNLFFIRPRCFGKSIFLNMLHCYVDTNQLTDYYYDMAYDGKWQEGLQFMADAYQKVSSVRDGIESERNLQGFFMAYLNLNDYYITAPELELNHGFCDFFLLPDHMHYASRHSYILELKVISKKYYEAKPDEGKLSKAEEQWQEAVAQIRRYSIAPMVEALRQGTALHKIILQFSGGELKRMEEVE
nr:PD-(D/E)XK nuclease domain-containing protein [uncultured Prevotella sp.]